MKNRVCIVQMEYCLFSDAYLFILFIRYENSLMKHLYYGACILPYWTSENAF